jgi:hypothetical protein
LDLEKVILLSKEMLDKIEPYLEYWIYIIKVKKAVSILETAFF